MNEIASNLDGHVFESSVLPNVYWTYHRIHDDDRGSMVEAARFSVVHQFAKQPIVQVNVSHSHAGVLRGLHLHRHQWDYWYIDKGQVQVVLGLENTPETRLLSAGNGVLIPPGVAHGFLAITDMTLIYAVTNEFNREQPDEETICYHKFGMWMQPARMMSERDRRACSGL